MKQIKELVIDETKIEISYNRSHSVTGLEKVIQESFEKVDSYFSFSAQKPKIIQFELMYSRREYNERVKREAQDWECAYVKNGVIIIFDPDALEKHSSHSKREFPDIVIHELTHIFTRAINSPTLNWVNEGLAQYVAEQDYGRSVDKADLDCFLENHLAMNTSYTKFINHSGYRISYLLVAYVLETFGPLSVEKIISLPGNADCTKRIEAIFNTPIKEVKQQLRREIGSGSKI